MEKKLLKTCRSFLLLLLLAPATASAQTVLYDESISGDLSNAMPGPVFTPASTGVYTVSGTVATPADGQDWFEINVPIGYQLSDVAYSISGGGFVGGVNFSFYGSASGAGSGSIDVSPFSYPLPSGVYGTQVFANFSTGTTWTMTYTITNPLLLNLKQVAVHNQGATNRLEWSTASEHAGDAFRIERSADAVHFTQLAELDAEGEASDYSYTDQLPVTGTNYYRLKMVALSGEVSYSKVLSAVIKAGPDLMQAFPNPVTGTLTLRINKPEDAAASVMVTDATGRIVYARGVTETVFTIDMTALTDGLYFLKYIGNNGDQTIRLIRN